MYTEDQTIESLIKKAQSDLTLEYVDARAVVGEWLSYYVLTPAMSSALITGSMRFVYSPTGVGVKAVRA
jgi:hypothetical protein